MNIEYIKRFIAVGQSLNFSKSAEALFISQPTLSHSISSIEKDLGTKLLLRNTKSVKLTRAGELFLPSAVELVRLYQSTVDRITQELELNSDELRIGYTGPVSDKRFAIWMNHYRKICPGIKVYITRYTSTTIVEAFESRAIHLGILFEMNAVKIPGLKYQVVNSEKFMLLLNAGHPLANEQKIDLALLKDEPFLITGPVTSHNLHEHVLDICESRGLKPNISQTVGQVGDLYRLIDAGLGISILSYSKTRSYDAYNVKFVEIEGDGEDLTNNVVVGWMDSLIPLACKFRSIVKTDNPT